MRACLVLLRQSLLGRSRVVVAAAQEKCWDLLYVDMGAGRRAANGCVQSYVDISVDCLLGLHPKTLGTSSHRRAAQHRQLISSCTDQVGPYQPVMRTSGLSNVSRFKLSQNQDVHC